jgi:hypothetical protein
LRHRAQEFGGTVSERTAEMSGRLYETARETPVRVSEGVNQAKDRAVSFIGDQPLVAGALGLAIGAVIAAALPKTNVEDEFMGEASDSIKRTAADLAAEQMEAAKSTATKLASEATRVASDMANQVKNEATKVAEREGLTPQGAAAAVHTATDKVKHAAGLDSDSGSNSKGSQSGTTGQSGSAAQSKGSQSGTIGQSGSATPSKSSQSATTGQSASATPSKGSQSGTSGQSASAAPSKGSQSGSFAQSTTESGTQSKGNQSGTFSRDNKV